MNQTPATQSPAPQTPKTSTPATQAPMAPAGNGSAGQLQTVSCTQRSSQASSGTTGTAASPKPAQLPSSAPAATGNTGTGAMGTGTSNTGNAAGSTGTVTGTLTGNGINNTAPGAANTTGTDAGSMMTPGKTGTAPGNMTPGTQSTETQGAAGQNNSGSTLAMQGGKSLSSLSVGEVCFLDKAAAANQFEILSSQLAVQKSGSSAVKKVAQQIIKDHQAAGAQLKALAAQYGAAPATQVNTQQQALLATLKSQSGTTFDVTYLTQQVSAHDEAVNLFRSYSQSASSPHQNVRGFASKVLPGLTMHAQMLKTVQKTVSNTSSGTALPATKSVSNGK